MIFPPVTELTVLGVAEPGVPNRERIIIRPTEPVNLAQFGIILGFRNPNGMVTPWLDNFFWFGEITIEPPSWIVVYTGKGEYQQTIVPASNQIAHSMHWGRDRTVFDVPNIVPVLFRMDAILIGNQLRVPTRQLKS